MTVQPQPYPGESVSAEQFFLLAEEYRGAADALFKIRRRGKPLSYAPFRHAAIHAIELYLNALLVKEGEKPCAVRAFRHDLEARANHPAIVRLRLRRGTSTHLSTMTQAREYLISRYGADQMDTLSPITRLNATLQDIRSKVAKQLGIAVDHQLKA